MSSSSRRAVAIGVVWGSLLAAGGFAAECARSAPPGGTIVVCRSAAGEEAHRSTCPTGAAVEVTPRGASIACGDAPTAVAGAVRCSSRPAGDPP